MARRPIPLDEKIKKAEAAVALNMTRRSMNLRDL